MAGKSNRYGTPTSTACTRSHQIGALGLVVTTFFLTRVLLQNFSASPSSSVANAGHYSSFETGNDAVVQHLRGSFAWPHRGFGTHLSLKIYVYDENEIDGLKLLLHGRDGKITPEACIKGQWGSQAN